jgi:hypothetical protein
MTTAWTIARAEASKNNTSPRIWLSYALTQAWMAVKSASDAALDKLAQLKQLGESFKKPAAKPVKHWHQSNPTNYSKATFEGLEQWGAWIAIKNQNELPRVGDLVSIKTKAGELHTRKVGKLCKVYKTGRIVQLVVDTEIAAKATQRYQATKQESKFTPVNGWCNKCQSYCYGDCEASR